MVPETTVNSDPIRRLADVLVGMNSKPSAQTLMVRPVSTTTLTLDGKSEKFELFEDLFHTMIEMQPEMTESIRSIISTPYYVRMHCKLSAKLTLPIGRRWKMYSQSLDEGMSNQNPRQLPNTNGTN